jgi:hypothetical protein
MSVPVIFSFTLTISSGTRQCGHSSEGFTTWFMRNSHPSEPATVMLLRFVVLLINPTSRILDALL